MLTALPQRSRQFLSISMILAALGLAYAPLPEQHQTIVVVAGTELQEPLQALEATFEQQHSEIKLELKFQGSQDIVNRFINRQNDFQPTVLIPANRELLDELNQRWQAQEGSAAFYETPQAIAKTRLVAIAWVERGKVLFPDGKFRWDRVEKAMQAGNWQAIGGSPTWGSFDFLTTDPTRSNSGQLTLDLWAQAKLGNSLNRANLSSPTTQSLFSLIKRSVYQPPRSTDVLLQEFISRGANDADVATVYESIALYRWQQAGANQGNPYQIYYLNPTIETISTAAIVRRDISDRTASAARTFINFLTQPSQQQVFVQYGFRPVNPGVTLQAVGNNPWNQNIPGARIDPGVTVLPPSNPTLLNEVIRQWERSP